MKTLLCAALCVAASSLALAQDANTQARASWGGYAGAVAGLSRIDVQCPKGVSCDTHTLGGKVLAGWRFDRELSVEAAYVRFGKATVGEADLKVSGFELGLALRSAFTDRLSPVFRVGVARVSSKVESALGPSSDHTRAQPYVGLGLDFRLMPELTLMGTVEGTRALDADRKTRPVVLIGAGALYHF